MKTRCTDVARLHLLDESCDEYAALVAHLDDCPHCQVRLDTVACSSETVSLITELEAVAVVDGADAIPASQKSDESQLAGSVRTSDRDADATLESPSHPELLGRLGRYDIERIVGRGGMGVVYKAMDTELHRVVAVKVLAQHLSANAAARRRFAREAQAAAAVLHANVIPIYNVEASGKSPYLVMQYVEGQSLQTRVEEQGPLGIVDALRIGKQTAEALAAAHGQGLVHRDVKPSNILLEEKTDRVVLSDFGLARTADDASLTQTGIVAGTPSYMSPEQARAGEISPASDIFALGSVLYFVLTGRPPFRAETAMGVLNCICTQPHRSIVQVNSDVPHELTRLIDRCLAKKQVKRFSDAKHVASELERILSLIQQGKIRLDGNRPAQRVAQALLPLVLVAFFGWMGWWLWPKADDPKKEPPMQQAQSRQTDVGGSPMQGASDPAKKDVEWLKRELSAREALSQQLSHFGDVQSKLNSPNPHQQWELFVNENAWDKELRQIDGEIDALGEQLDVYRQFDFATPNQSR